MNTVCLEWITCNTNYPALHQCSCKPHLVTYIALSLLHNVFCILSIKSKRYYSTQMSFPKYLPQATSHHILMTPCVTLAISFRNKNEIHECGMYFSSINAFLGPSGLWQVNTTKFPGSSLVMHLMEIAHFLSFCSFEAWKQ